MATRFFLLLSTPFPPLRRLSLSLSPLRLQPALYTLSPRLQFHSQATTANADHHQNHRISPSPPLPEWFSLLERLSSGDYFNRYSSIDYDSSFLSSSSIQADFLRASRACLAFASDRPNLLRSLPRRDIDVVIANVSPFLFANGSQSANAIRLFLSGNETAVSESTKACTVDLMRFLLSYTYNFAEYNNELVESSVRSLLREMANAMYSPSQTDFSGSAPKQFPDNSGQQTTGTFRQNIEMKRGDWICTRCSFMNFARNVKCLECEEARPKRQLTGGEWECPQCDFFNYGKNMVCLRCDCKRPGEASANATNSRSILGDIDGKYANKLDSTSEHNAGDFPEIMPLRKGVNRFVVSTRKTPLERRLDNSQYQTSLGNDSTSGSNTIENRSLDDILGRTCTVDGENKNILSRQNSGFSRGNSSNYVPFVPLPADTFAKKTQAGKPMEGEISEQKDQIYGEDKDNLLHSQKLDIQMDKEKEQAEKSERWFKKVAELHDVTDLASAISDEDFPEIMPMRKGENRFVVGKKKDRSLTTPMYKRKMAMEQTGSTNFVPFVPFPPDYFTKKSNPGETSEKAETSAATENLQSGMENWNFPSSEINLTEKKADFVSSMPNNDSNTTKKFTNPGTTTNNNWNNGGYSGKNDAAQNTNFQGSVNQNNENGNTKGGWTGKSLEGSAVKELDPLDMSEEGKAERWFRRAAQIKDISELSEIPDEDFPSIMPMRKGVNRFVVSKRKTPLERRLTSPQYRRNLPVVSSEPPVLNKENDSS